MNKKSKKKMPNLSLSLKLQQSNLSSSSTYPASVVKAGLQSVWNLQTTAGLNGPLLWTPTAPQGGSLPPEWSISGANVHIAGNGSWSDYDFSTYTVWIDGTVTVELSNCKFGHQVSNDNLSIQINASNNGAAAVTFTNCLIDQSTGADFFEAAIQHNGVGGSLTMSYCIGTNISCSTIQIICSTSNISNCWFTSPALNSAPTNHANILHYYIGTHTLTDVLFDTRSGTATCGLTSDAFAEGVNGNVSVDLSNSIFVGVSSFGFGYPIHATSGTTQTSTINVADCVIDEGVFGYFATTNGGAAVAVNNNGGNLDFVTGDPIV